jgi:hypothetical protein
MLEGIREILSVTRFGLPKKLRRLMWLNGAVRVPKREAMAFSFDWHDGISQWWSRSLNYYDFRAWGRLWSSIIITHRLLRNCYAHRLDPIIDFAVQVGLRTLAAKKERQNEGDRNLHVGHPPSLAAMADVAAGTYHSVWSPDNYYE